MEGVQRVTEAQAFLGPQERPGPDLQLMYKLQEGLVLVLEFKQMHEFVAEHEYLQRLERREFGLAEDLNKVREGGFVGLELAGQFVDLEGLEVICVEVVVGEDGCEFAIVLGLEQLQHRL